MRVRDQAPARDAPTAEQAPITPPPTGRPSRRSYIRRGPLYMILAGLMFMIMIGTVKVARQHMTPFEVAFWRGAFSAPLAFVFARQHGLAVRNRRAMLLRSLLGFGAMSCFFTAARGLSLADLSILHKLQPILVAIVAPVALGASERARPLVWAALLVGLSGCALIIGPELQIGSVYGLWALAAASLSAGAHVAVRALGRTESPYTVVFWFHLLVAVLAFAVQTLSTWDAFPLPPVAMWPYLVGCGVAATLAQVLMTRAYALDRAAPVAAASYATPLFGVIGDLVVFRTVPPFTALLGGALVVGGGLLLVLRRSSTTDSEGEL